MIIAGNRLSSDDGGEKIWGLRSSVEGSDRCSVEVVNNSGLWNMDIAGKQPAMHAFFFIVLGLQWGTRRCVVTRVSTF